MQMVKKSLLSLLAIVIFGAIFAPKKEIYYMLEDQLLQYDVIISNESIEESLFSLHLSDADIYLKGIKIAKIETIEFFTLLLYNSVDIHGVEVDSSLKNLLPTQIDSVHATYTVLDPQSLSLDVNGSFGSAEGYLDIAQQSVRMDLVEEGSIGSLREMLKRGEDGWYYATSF